MAPQGEFVRILKRDLGLSFLEGRKRRSPPSSPQRVASKLAEEPKQACVYRYYPHSDIVQVNPVSATEERVFNSKYQVAQVQFPGSKSIALAY
ncbi:hypothetical protein RND71_005096 [Anisodus tanguticus]|uniref:Uncharacterized protein n=1 Tax=Anisodus tanguticus TaxID=243964 RepID=A0AAE1SR78_9SOLA|nr:hypothetical protein RND71_005096 [Anisodus tanguticus]